MSHVPECTYVDADAGVDCDQPATVELRAGKKNDTLGLGDRLEAACSQEHADLLVGDDVLVEMWALQEPPANVIRVDPIDASMIEAAPERCTVAVPEGYECTRIPHATGPCALRQIVSTPAPFLGATQVPTKHRPSKWSTPWILLLGLIGYELWAVATSKPGGPLSHLVWWAYGDRWSLRWWVCSSALNGLGLWAAAHFMFEWPEVKELLITVACAIGVGLIGWFVTR